MVKTVTATVLIAITGIAYAQEARVNSKNADTLRQSIQKIGANLTEQERQAFGQDLILVDDFIRKQSDPSKLYFSNLYSRNYGILFLKDVNKMPFMDRAFQQMALNAGS